jgi:hypothetical protein
MKTSKSFINEIKSEGILLRNVRVLTAVQLSNRMPSNHFDVAGFNLWCKGQFILVEDKIGNNVVIPLANVVFFTPAQD